MSTSGQAARLFLVLFAAWTGASPGHAQAPDPAPPPERAAPRAGAFEIEGLSEWSDAVQGDVTWPRVAFPTPRERPADEGLVLRSLL